MYVRMHYYINGIEHTADCGVQASRVGA